MPQRTKAIATLGIMGVCLLVLLLAPHIGIELPEDIRQQLLMLFTTGAVGVGAWLAPQPKKADE